MAELRIVCFVLINKVECTHCGLLSRYNFKLTYFCFRPKQHEIQQYHHYGPKKHRVEQGRDNANWKRGKDKYARRTCLSFPYSIIPLYLRILSTGDTSHLAKQFKSFSDKDGKVPRSAFKDVITKHYGGEDNTLVRIIFNIFDKDGDQ
mgnify:CR=1 FL=1